MRRGLLEGLGFEGLGYDEGREPGNRPGSFGKINATSTPGPVRASRFQAVSAFGVWGFR